MRKLLTAKNVKTLPYKPPGKSTDWRDTLLPGLVLRVFPSGVRTWVLEYHEQRGAASVGRRHKLARLDRMTLAKARDEARETLAKIAAAVVLTSSRDLTVARLVEKTLAGLKHLRPATRKEWDRLLKVEIRDQLGDVLAERLTRAEVRAWHRDLAARSGYVARHALALLKRAYSWGVAEDLLPYSPLAGIASDFRPEASERVLSTLKAGALVRALGALSGPYRDATLLLLLTGVRRAAVLGAKRGEFHNIDTDFPMVYGKHDDPKAQELAENGSPRWVIPGGAGGRSKNKQAHVVPLSADAVAVVRRRLAAVSAVHLFPRSHQPHGVDVPSVWPTRWVNILKAATLAQYRLAVKDAAATMEPWKVHGIRHTLSTHMKEDLGVDSEVTELILGHARGGMRGVYDRSKLLPQRRAALVAWAAWLERVAKTEEERGASVLPFAR